MPPPFVLRLRWMRCIHTQKENPSYSYSDSIKRLAVDGDKIFLFFVPDDYVQNRFGSLHSFLQVLLTLTPNFKISF